MVMLWSRPSPGRPVCDVQSDGPGVPAAPRPFLSVTAVKLIPENVQKIDHTSGSWEACSGASLPRIGLGRSGKVLPFDN